MAQILISQLHFSYDQYYDPIFENVSLTLDSSWRLGLIGRNGKGKTTLLRLMMGDYEYGGKIHSDLAFSYFPYDVSAPSSLTLDIAADICPELESWQLRRELNLLDVDTGVLERPYNSLSMGEQTKVMLAILFLKPNQFLLIDEPTNHLDIKGREQTASYLAHKEGFILVSHDRAFLDATIDHVLSINQADITLEKGNFSSWLENKQRQDSFENKENIKLQGQIKQLEAAAERTGSWSTRVENSKIGFAVADRGFVGAKSAKMMKRSKAIEKRVKKAQEDKSGLLHNIERSFELAIHPIPYFKPVLIRALDLSFGYGDRCLVRNLSFNLERGDRLGLIGANGSGKSSLLRLICGELPNAEEADFWMEGSCDRGTRLNLSYMPQDTSKLSGELAGFARLNGIDDALFRAILNKLDFPAIQFDKRIESYSAGQKKKLLLARTLCEEANLYVWDEPLNYIDVLSRMQIGALLDNYEPTMVLVEHDRAFVEAAVTKIINLADYACN